jgi:hypothetical protein
MGRGCPDLDAELFFEVDEIRGAYLLTDVKQPAKPKLDEVLRLIARLGGFFGRKGDGEPGAKAVWLGLKGACRCEDIAEVTRRRSHWTWCISRWVR